MVKMSIMLVMVAKNRKVLRTLIKRNPRHRARRECALNVVGLFIIHSVFHFN